MEINDELIACYVEGKVTAEEKTFVRKYLIRHPEEYERVLYMMDNIISDSVDVHRDDSITPFSLVSGIAYSAAAFAPVPKGTNAPKQKKRMRNPEALYDRLCKMSDELDSILD